MSHRRPGSVPSWVRVGLGLIFVLAICGAVFVLTPVPAEDAAAPVLDPPAASQSDEEAAPSVGEIAFRQADRALQRRAANVLAGRAAVLGDVPFRRFDIRLPISAQPSRHDVTNGRFEASVVIRYQLPVEPVSIRRAADATFAFVRHRWRLAGLKSAGDDLWDHQRVDVLQQGRSVVIGSSTLTDRLPTLAAQVESARLDVARFWSSGWPTRVVVVVPDRPALMDELTGIPAASGVPAVTTWSEGPDGRAIRVTLNAQTVFAQPELSQEIILRHEITHVAQDALPYDVPTWLAEGLAEYVGYRESGVPSSVVAMRALGQVAGGDLPRSLPSDAVFAFDNGGDRRLGYELGYAACAMVAERYGEQKLVPFYRTVARTAGSTQSRIANASKEVLGISSTTFVEQWQGWLLDNS